jgi:hypothetical protein
MRKIMTHRVYKDKTLQLAARLRFQHRTTKEKSIKMANDLASIVPIDWLLKWNSSELHAEWKRIKEMNNVW